MESKLLFQELSSTEAANLYGGDWINNLGHNTKVAYNKLCDAVGEFLIPSDPKMSETLMNCI